MASKRALDFCDTPPSKKIKMSTNSPVRQFQENWKVGNAWLRYEPSSKSMFCDVCVKVQKTNSFTVGCSVLKRDSVTKHSKCKDHILAVTASKQSVSMETARLTVLSKNERAITSALKNVYFASEHNIPSVLVPELNALCIEQGATQLNDLRPDSHTTYEHHHSIGEFQQAISDVLMTDVVQKTKTSGNYSIMLDESTDISVHQNLIVYIRVLESDKFGTVVPHTYLLGVSDLQRANAECIYNKVTDMLVEKGICLKGLCGISTDGAAVMVGNKSGVVTRFKEKIPGVLATHCIAHRLALSCCAGADAIPYLVKFQEIMNSIYKYFHFSPKNMATLSSIQNILQGHSKRFKEIFHTRWLSFEGAVDALVTNYPSLVSVFLEESSGKALSLYKPITCYKFLYTAHFLCDALKPLALLSKMYQKSDLNFSEVTPLLKSTIKTLEQLRDNKNGEVLAQFLRAVPSSPTTDTSGLVTFEFEGHTIRDSLQQRTDAESNCTKFVNGMVKSLNERFTNNADGLVLTSLSNLFNPLLKDIERDTECVSDYLGTIGMEGFKSELKSFVSFSREFHDNGNKSVHDVTSCINLALRNREIFPATAIAAERLLVTPISTADCERGFSRQNLIKTSLRNSMSSKTLNNLMVIAVNGPGFKIFEYKRAFECWAKMKARRILN